MKQGITFLITSILLLLLSQALWGGIQDNKAVEQEFLEDVDVDSIGNHAASLVSSIKAEFEQSREVRQKMAVAGREDSLVLELRYTKLRIQLVTRIHSLADILVDLEKKQPQKELRAEVERLFEYVTPLIWEYIERRRGQIDDLRNRRHSTDVKDLPVLEEEIALLTGYLDDAFKYGLDHIRKMDKLEMDSSGARETLTSLLSDRAAEVSGRIDLALQRIDQVEARLKDTPDNTDLPILSVSAHKSLKTNTKSMTATLDIMDSLKMPAKDYRAQVVEATRDVSRVILDKDAAASLISRAANRFMSWLGATGPGLVVKLALFILLLYIFRLLSRIARKGTTRALDSSKVGVSTLLRRMIITAVANVVMILGLLIALSQLGINLAPLLAGFGVIGFIVGFALQDTLSNFAAGLMILIYRPYDVGDMVDAGGVFGKVNKMSLVSTTILTIDNQTIIIPNSKIWGDVIKNVTAQDLRRVDLTFGISYSDDIPKAEQVLMDILKQHDKVLDDPAPAVKLHELGESSVNFVVRPWVDVDDYWDVYWDVTRAVKMRFDEDGISIPFPQRDVHIHQSHGIEKKKGDSTDV